MVPGLCGCLAALAMQPDTASLRHAFEENLARRLKEFGSADARTAQAARGLALFLQRKGDKPAARRALRTPFHKYDRRSPPSI